MIKLRKPSEVILSNGKTLEEVLELHNKWLKNEKGGEKADLRGTDLSYADLRYADLYNADLSEASLRYTNLYNANLSEVDLRYTNLNYADLRCADLSYAKLRYTNLSYANLTNTEFYLTDLYKAKGDFVSVGNIGSRNDTTHYFYNIDRVICGCFDGTMEQFEEKVKKSYGEDEVEYKEYMIAIRTLKELAKIELER